MLKVCHIHCLSKVFTSTSTARVQQHFGLKYWNTTLNILLCETEYDLLKGQLVLEMLSYTQYQYQRQRTQIFDTGINLFPRTGTWDYILYTLSLFLTNTNLVFSKILMFWLSIAYCRCQMFMHPVPVMGQDSKQVNYSSLVWFKINTEGSNLKLVQSTFLLFQTDAHNYKIVGILKQLKFRLLLRHVPSSTVYSTLAQQAGMLPWHWSRQ